MLIKGGTLTTVVIASYFEEEYVRRIREVDERLKVLYREDLVPPPRWPGDHAGPEEWERTPEDEGEFLAMLGEAEVLYDFPGQELTAIDVGPSYVAVASNDFPPPAPPGDAKDPTARAKRSKPGKGSVFLLARDGTVEELGKFDDAHVSVKAHAALADRRIPEGTLINVNCPAGETTGVEVTHLGSLEQPSGRDPGVRADGIDVHVDRDRMSRYRRRARRRDPAGLVGLRRRGRGIHQPVC